MKISLNWVKKYTDIKLSPDELKDRVSVSLTEVQEVIDIGKLYKGITVAEVTEVNKHGSSNNLLVLKLDVGKKSVKSVIQKCPVKKGDKVSYVRPGLVVPGLDQVVKKTEIKGVKSEGFVPSGKEIGLNYDHTNVFTLPVKSKVGQEICDVLNLDDLIIEIKNKTLTHRPDTFGLYGIAREISAIQGTMLKRIDWLDNPTKIKPKGIKDEYKLEIRNKAKSLCKRYMAVVIKGVNVKESPLWMQVELSKMGIHPVNNIVDVSNYLMLLTGQPSHAFDYDKVIKKDAKFDGTAVLTIRLSKGGEKVTTLDGEVRELDNEMIVIADSTNPIAVAGVMGGKDTEITESTRNVIYQVENLDMYSIRKTSMKLGLITDAVIRFSKGIDPNLCEPVMYKALDMMIKFTGGKIVSKIVDVYPETVKEWSVSVKPENIRKKIGIDIKDEKIEEVLKRLGLKVKKSKSGIWSVLIPTFRPDIRISEDIDEEVARIYGYDKVEIKLPVRKCLPVVDDVARRNIMMVKRSLMSFGANEIYNYAFVSSDLYSKCNLSIDNCFRIVNAISSDLDYMRPLVVPSLLENVPMNYKTYGDYASFEVDRVDPCKKSKTKKLPNEPWHLGFAHTVSYYHSKKYLDELFVNLGISNYELIPVTKIVAADLPDWLKYSRGMYHPSRAAIVKVEREYVGIVGQIDVVTVDKIGIPTNTSAFEINLDGIEFIIIDTPSYKIISKYPEVTRDYSFITDLGVPYIEIVEAVKSVDKKAKLLQKIECVDIFKAPKDRKSKKTTLRITYQSKDKTLKDNDIEVIEKKVIDSVGKKVKGKLAK